jgi:hypothetical protein
MAGKPPRQINEGKVFHLKGVNQGCSSVFIITLDHFEYFKLLHRICLIVRRHNIWHYLCSSVYSLLPQPESKESPSKC